MSMNSLLKTLIIPLLFVAISCFQDCPNDGSSQRVGKRDAKYGAYFKSEKSEKSENVRKEEKQGRKTKIIAHRGYWRPNGSYQNSLRAIDEAAVLGADGVELDIWVTKDDSVVVNHNSSYAGKPIWGTSYYELSKVPLPNGEHLPTFREYVRKARQYPELILIIEIKTVSATHFALEILKDENIPNSYYFCSIYRAACEAVIKDRQLRFNRAFLLSSIDPEETVASLKNKGYYGLLYNKELFKEKKDLLLQSYHEDMSLATWDINSVEEYNWLVSNSFSFAISDNPDLLVAATSSKESDYYW